MTLKLSFNLPFGLGKAEYEHQQSLENYGRQPLFEKVKATQDALVHAVSHGQMRETAHHLMLLAGLVDPSDRKDAVHLHRALLELAEKHESSGMTPDDLGRRETLFREALDLAVSMAELVLARLQVHQGEDAGPSASSPQAPNGRRAPQSSVIRASRLSVSHRGVDVLRDVDVHVEPGEIVGVIGRNGSGKTTLLRALGGVQAPTGGGVSYPALERRFSRHAAIMNEVHFVEEAPAAWPGTVEVCLRMYGALRGVSRQKNADQVAYVIELLGLSQYRAHRFRELSSGYRTRFELAKAMVMYPSALLLDEPFGPLDAFGRRWYLRVLRDMAKSPIYQMAVVVSAQDTHHIGQIADRVLIVEDRTVRPVDDPCTRERSIFEIVTSGASEELEGVFSSVPSATIDFDVLPCRLIAPGSVTAEDVLRLLARAGLRVQYFRDISDSPDRFLGKPA